MKKHHEDFSLIDIGSTNISALNLAYIGDAIFEVFVRTKVIEEGGAPVNTLHEKSKSIVNARSQNQMYHKLEEFVTNDEMQVMKRGRNAKSTTKPKSATISEYRHATGVEALFGYLFLKGDTKRLRYLFGLCLDNINSRGETNEA